VPVLPSKFLRISLSLATAHLASAIGGTCCSKGQCLHKLGSQLGQLGGCCVQLSGSGILFSSKGFDVRQQGSELLSQVFTCVEGISKLDSIVVLGAEYGGVEVVHGCSSEGLEATGVVYHDSDNGEEFGLIIGGE
jgi:hypothetical protein